MTFEDTDALRDVMTVNVGPPQQTLEEPSGMAGKRMTPPPRAASHASPDQALRTSSSARAHHVCSGTRAIDGELPTVPAQPDAPPHPMRVCGQRFRVPLTSEAVSCTSVVHGLLMRHV
jgi:hypothetical protein